MSEREPRSTTVFRHFKSGFAVLLSLAVLLGGAWFALDKVGDQLGQVLAVEDYPGPGEAEVAVEVPDGASVSKIGDVLIAQDVVAGEEAWDRAVQQNPTGAQSIQAGHYTMKTKMRAADALALLLDPASQARAQVTIREGLRLGEQYQALADQTGLPKGDFEEAGKDAEALGLPAYADGNPEGFLFPETYGVQTNGGAAPVLKTMVSQFDKVATDIDIEGRAKAIGREPRDIVIVASIIEEEVKRAEDRPKVARVLYNRLDKGMPLQLDTTVMYANNKRGGASTSKEMRANKSPYNTYVHKGLPPGPISAPGKASLEAAANPSDGSWLYFVAINLETGETAFADTLDEHNRNIAKWRKWCSDNPGKC